MPAHSIMFCLSFRSGLSNLHLDNIRRLISFVSVFVSVCVFVYAFDDLPRFPQLSNGTLWRHPARPQLVRPHIPPTLVSLCVTVGELRTSFHCHSTSSQPPTPPPWSQGSPTTPTTPPTDPTYYPSRPPDSDSIHTLIFIFIESKTEAFAIRWPAQFQKAKRSHIMACVKTKNPHLDLPHPLFVKSQHQCTSCYQQLINNVPWVRQDNCLQMLRHANVSRTNPRNPAAKCLLLKRVRQNFAMASSRPSL